MQVRPTTHTDSDGKYHPAVMLDLWNNGVENWLILDDSYDIQEEAYIRAEAALQVLTLQFDAWLHTAGFNEL